MRVVYGVATFSILLCSQCMQCPPWVLACWYVAVMQSELWRAWQAPRRHLGGKATALVDVRASSYDSAFYKPRI